MSFKPEFCVNLSYSLFFHLLLSLKGIKPHLSSRVAALSNIICYNIANLLLISPNLVIIISSASSLHTFASNPVLAVTHFFIPLINYSPCAPGITSAFSFSRKFTVLECVSCLQRLPSSHITHKSSPSWCADAIRILEGTMGAYPPKPGQRMIS